MLQYIFDPPVLLVVLFYIAWEMAILFFFVNINTSKNCEIIFISFFFVTKALKKLLLTLGWVMVRVRE